ncbi:protein FAM205A [Echinops telfairi]|uniref:Protein FAM205A n=1 Tax=Echinops telfairi TaxID=9371 RepID=A0AC55DS43_ECHTE|nr:protein FAM205A [Echinops telfairi]
MLSPIFVPWGILYFLYTYGSLLLIILLLWQMKSSHHGLQREPPKSSCRVGKHPDHYSRRASRKEAEKPWELLSIMKSQSWLPQEGSVRRLLCTDHCCHVCNDAALEIGQLLTSENTPTAPVSVGVAQSSSCVEIVSMSSVSFEQTLELPPQHLGELSTASVTPSLTQLTDQGVLTQTAAPSVNVVNLQEYWAEHLDLEPEFQLQDAPGDPGTLSSLKNEERGFPVNQPEMANTSYQFIQGSQGQQALNPHSPLLPLKTELANNLTHPMALPMDTALPARLPLLSPEVLSFLEVHVKKWVHFQRWGLPRRVEQSLRQLMPGPPLLYQPGTGRVHFIMSNSSNTCIDSIGTISHQTWGSCMVGQPTQAFWVSEWPTADPERRQHCQEAPNSLALALPSPTLQALNGLYSQAGGQAEDSGDPLRHKYRQLFCGLPCLHSESLVATFMSAQGLTANKSMSQTSLDVSFLLKDPSFLPLMPNNPPLSALPASPPVPNGVPPPDLQQIQVKVPFLTLAECKDLEWHLLQRKLRLRWDLPHVPQTSQSALSPDVYKTCGTAQPPATMELAWSQKPVSVLTRELLFPDHARRLLDFHLQKQLIYSRWGLPQMIKQSIQLYLSPADPQSLPRSSTALDNVSVPWLAAPETNEVSGLFSSTSAPALVSMPHLLTQAKATLQSHISSKGCQIHQGSIPARVWISWNCSIPGNQAVTPFPCILERKALELQAATDTDLYEKGVPWMPTANGQQQQQTSPGAVIEHTKLARSLSEEAIQKLETALRHKYLAFLSGLPALYYVALSKSMAPAITGHSEQAEIMPKPVESTTEALPESISYEEECIIPEPVLEEGTEVCEDHVQEFLSEVSEEEAMEMGPLDMQTEAGISQLFSAPILAKVNFHLRRKVLEIRMGIPKRARASRDQSITILENPSPQEALKSPKQRNASLQDLPADVSRAPDAQWVLLKEQLTTELKAVQHSRKQASPRAMSHGVAHWTSKSSQPSTDMMEAQVLCVQVEAQVNSPSLEETWCPESQEPGKSKDSGQGPTVTEKKKHPGKPTPAGDQGEGDAGLGFPSKRENRHAAGLQKPAEKPANRTPQGPWLRSHSFDFAASCQQHPQFKISELPPRVPGGEEYEKNSQASQTQPLLGPLIQSKPWKGQSLWNHSLHGRAMTAHTHKSPSLPESGLRNKMKHLLLSLNSKKKGKADNDSMSPLAKTGTKPRKKIAEKNLAPAKSPVGQAKTEKTKGDPKAQSFLTEKHGLAFSDGPQVLDKQPQQHSHQVHSASVLGQPRHCPRHCPGVVRAMQQGNPP